MSRVVICCTSSAAESLVRKAAKPRLGLAGVAALGDRAQLGLVGGDRGLGGGGLRGGGRGGLLLAGDGHLGLVHLLVDGGQVLGGLARELAGLARPTPGPRSAARARAVRSRRRRARRRAATAARERRRGVVRVDCTVGLRQRAPGPGKGPHSMRVRTDGREVLSTSNGGRAGQLLRIAPSVTASVTGAPFATCPNATENGGQTSECAPGAHSTRGKWQPGPHTVRRAASGGARGVRHQPARGSWACRLVTASRSRRIAASSSAVHGSQQSQPPSR